MLDMALGICLMKTENQYDHQTEIKENCMSCEHLEEKMKVRNDYGERIFQFLQPFI